MKRIAKFHKVSFEQFKEGWIDTFGEAGESEIQKIYDAVKLPKRATSGSAGYDFYTPISLTIQPGETVKIPTGIRVEMEENWVLKCYPRSGLGLNFVCSLIIRLVLSTVITFIRTMKGIFLQN